MRVLIIAAAALSFKAAAVDLPKLVQQGLRSAGVPPSAVGVVVQEAGGNRTALALNANAVMNPASVMKLVTTYAALELLGPAYRWKTEAYLDGENLVLRGYGDPKLNYESFWMLLRNLRGRGLRELRGDVVLDRSFFDAGAQYAPFDSDIYRPYNVAPDALLVNFKALRFVFVPESGGTVRIYAEPAMGLEISNTLKPSSEAACPDGNRAFRELIRAEFQPRPPRASFSGIYPISCGERELNVALHDPADYFAGIMRQLWTEVGGRWTGSVREGVASPDARLLYVHESEPLTEIVRDINKFSNNVMARQLFLTLGAELGGSPGQAQKAAQVIKQWVADKKIRAPELELENGSGLSRIERISPAHLAQLLQAAWGSTVMPEFVSSLPVVAADGTMRKRLRGERVAGQAHIKTGLLSDARSIAGYVLDRSGRRWVVVMLVNHPRAPEADAAIDALLEWVYDGARGLAPSTAGPRGASPRGP